MASVPLSRGPGTYGDVSVRYTATSGTASIGSDFLLPASRVVIADGVAMATINVTIMDDEDREFAEMFQLTLLSVTGECSSSIRKLQELKFYYKLVHKQLPSYFNCISVTTINTVHQHNTRQSENLYSDRVKHDFAKRCIRFSVIDTVNKTDTSIISKIFTHSIYGFTHYTKDRILQNYVYTRNINNCYVCDGI